MPENDANRAIRLLVADSLEALLPMVDQWVVEVVSRRMAEPTHAYSRGYAAGARAMAAEVKDQLVNRIVRLRE